MGVWSFGSCAPAPSVQPAPSAAPGAAEIVTVAGGHELRGVPVKESAEALFLDVGYTILEVPRRAIIRRRPAGEEAAGAAEQAESIFFTARLPRASIQKHVETFAEAVVMISTPGGLGSGFIVNEKEGYVVTNYHVIAGEREITVTLFLRKGQEFENVKFKEARIVAQSPFLDLALLKIENTGGTALKKVYIGDSRELRAGDAVFAVGNPLGLSRSVSEGIVSNRTREFEGQIYIQTTAAINPGNSGGPLFNDRGEVVGVTNMKIAQIAESLGFAIPSHTLKDFLRDYEAYAFDKDNPESGIRYFAPPGKPKPK